MSGRSATYVALCRPRRPRADCSVLTCAGTGPRGTVCDAGGGDPDLAARATAAVGGRHAGGSVRLPCGRLRGAGLLGSAGFDQPRGYRLYVQLCGWQLRLRASSSGTRLHLDPSRRPFARAISGSSNPFGHVGCISTASAPSAAFALLPASPAAAAADSRLAYPHPSSVGERLESEPFERIGSATPDLADVSAPVGVGRTPQPYGLALRRTALSALSPSPCRPSAASASVHPSLSKFGALVALHYPSPSSIASSFDLFTSIHGTFTR